MNYKNWLFLLAVLALGYWLGTKFPGAVASVVGSAA